MAQSVPACFVYADQIQEKSGYKISIACEKSTGPHGIEGVQRLGKLIRIYCLTKLARDRLLMNGLNIDKTHVPVIGTNPMVVPGSAEAVKLIIGQIPLSLANSEIEKALADMSDIKVRSKMFYEHYRDDEGKLSSYKSGRRFVYIDKPASPLPKFITIVKWKASLYHFGQKSAAADNIKSPAGASSGSTDIDPSSQKEATSETSPDSAPTLDSQPPKSDTPSGSVSASSREEGRDTNQKSLDSFFRVPGKTSSSPATRGRAKARQPRSRSLSASTRRKRNPSDDQDMVGAESKTLKGDGFSATPDYFEFDPTKA